MTELKYNQVQGFIKKLKPDNFPQIVLLFGEEYLYKKVLNEVLDTVLPESERSLGYEQIEPDASVYDALELMGTYSFLGGKKVVCLKDSRIFASKKNEESLLLKAEQASVKNELKKASGFFLKLLSLHNLGYDDLSKNNRNSSKLKIDNTKDTSWLDRILDYCTENNLSVPEKKDDASALVTALDKGFPAGNHLIITAEVIDKRKQLYKRIKEIGTVVDCFVPKGERAADKKVQESVLIQHMKETLNKNNLTMDQNSFRVLMGMTGFDLRVFSGNLDKLVDYCREKGKITAEDVRSVLKRTKQDPIFELTGSVADRNLVKTLFFMESLISSGIHPLQILSAMVNQVRKLILIRDFLDSGAGKVWKPGCQFNTFKSQVLPVMLEYEKKNNALLETWNHELNPESQKRKKKVKTDLKLVPNPKSPYPVYLTLQKAGNYTKKELISSFESLHQADYLLKSSGGDPKMVLEKTIMDIMIRK